MRKRRREGRRRHSGPTWAGVHHEAQRASTDRPPYREDQIMCKYDISRCHVEGVRVSGEKSHQKRDNGTQRIQKPKQGKTPVRREKTGMPGVQTSNYDVKTSLTTRQARGGPAWSQHSTARRSITERQFGPAQASHEDMPARNTRREYNESHTSTPQGQEIEDSEKS